MTPTRRVTTDTPATGGADAATATIVNLLRSSPGLSRTEITAETALSKTVVNQRVQELLAAGVLTQTGMLPSSGGRPAKGLRLAAGKGYVLAAELGMTHARVAATDLEGRTLRVAEEALDMKDAPEVVLKAVTAAMTSCAADAAPGARLCGIGMGVPAPVEFDTGRAIAPPVNPHWHEFPIKDWLERRLGAPAWIDNEVNLMALAESQRGAAVGHDHALVVKIGAWVGAGLISNGRLHRGAQGSAGSLVSMAGGEALLREAAIVAGKHPGGPLHALFSAGRPRIEDVVRLADEGDQPSAVLLQEAAEDIGRTIAVCVDFFNPSMIVIAGGLGTSGDRFLAQIRKVVYGNALALATRDLVIAPSPLGRDSGMLGAAALALDEVFSAERLGGTIQRLLGTAGAGETSR
ncbi:ROK family protein [Actinomadura viridis]|uniref:ROK family protein n=1 Tax=Actinomadura viridis TaxID=58110 RepID=UPI00368A76F2